jgi:hypothetical protein
MISGSTTETAANRFFDAPRPQFVYSMVKEVNMVFVRFVFFYLTV